jgi:hypothetical protein
VQATRIVIDLRDGAGRADVMRRAHIQSGPRPTQGKLRQAFRQKREEGDRDSAPEKTDQELPRLRIACRIG